VQLSLRHELFPRQRGRQQLRWIPRIDDAIIASNLFSVGNVFLK
jgi:hypothetical protein